MDSFKKDIINYTPLRIDIGAYFEISLLTIS